MPYIAPPFTPSVTISGTDLIRNTDEKLQTISDEVGTYLETESQAVYDDLELQFEALEDSLMLVNPDGTYYTKSAIDALVNAKVSKVASTDNAIARFDGTTGAIQNSGVVINDSWNVGIGVTPSTQLEVAIADGASTQGIRIKNLDSSMVAGQTVGALEVYSSDPSGAGVGVKGAIRVKSYDSVGSAYDMVFTTSDATTNDKIALTIPNTGGIQLPNTAIANATTLDWYEEATATLTATGMTTAPTGTGRFTRNGDTVTALMPTISGTSNATTFTLTGIPTSFRPSADRNVLVRVQDNGGAIVVSNATINLSGVLTMYKDVGVTAFTASGTKSAQAIQIQYHI